jgi:hypothetical protein
MYHTILFIAYCINYLSPHSHVLLDKIVKELWNEAASSVLIGVEYNILELTRLHNKIIDKLVNARCGNEFTDMMKRMDFRDLSLRDGVRARASMSAAKTKSEEKNSACTEGVKNNKRKCNFDNNL